LMGEMLIHGRDLFDPQAANVVSRTRILPTLAGDL